LEDLDRRGCKVVPLAENDHWIRIPKIQNYDDDFIEIKTL